MRDRLMSSGVLNFFLSRIGQKIGVLRQPHQKKEPHRIWPLFVLEVDQPKSLSQKNIKLAKVLSIKISVLHRPVSVHLDEEFHIVIHLCTDP